MAVIIFVIVLGILVFVHELGHFLAAKKAGVRVDEFGLGYPPRAVKIGKKWGTLFTLNWIPFGGFVKIWGENYEEKDDDRKETGIGKKFTNVSKKWQAAILAAGVIFNILFAWFLFSVGFMIGLPTSIDSIYGNEVKNSSLTIINVLDDSPAKEAGLKSGDKIKMLSSENEFLQDINAEKVSQFINQSQNKISIEVDRGGKILNFDILPNAEIETGRKIIGINMNMVGTLTLPLHKAIYEGGRATIDLTQVMVVGISNLIYDVFKGQADVSNIAGPVGIAGLVGDASKLGFAYLISFTALISINLAILNLLPIPALDGGRILFVAIEGIIKRPINPMVASNVNTVGFFILIGLMLIVTYRDILRLF
ncbi:MAG: RIP metalloprotease RseP [Candidatus Zambryskibacteria bacterium]|nr:RIP metalloprotease RseP [Candidatus Zambryskibacteria bacterium]